MLEMKSVAKSIKYCALEYCAEKSTAKLVQFFFLTNQSKRILRFKLLYCTKFDRFIFSFDQDSIISLSLCFRRLTRWRWWTWWQSCCGRPSPPPSGPCHPSASSSYHRRCNIAWRLEQTFHISTLEPFISIYRMDAHFFTCSVNWCVEIHQNLIHSMRVILIGWLTLLGPAYLSISKYLGFSRG